MASSLRILFFIQILVYCLQPYWIIAQNGDPDFIKKAENHLDSLNYDEALTDLDSAAVHNPRKAKIYFLRGEVHKRLDKINEAINDYTQGINMDASNDTAFFNRAKLFAKAGYHRGYALRDLNEAISLNDINPEYYIYRAHIYASTINTQTGNLEFGKAIRDVTHAIAIKPDNENYYALRGEYRFERGERNAAIVDMDKAIDLNPDNPEFWGDRGLMKLLMEDFNGAGEDLDRAIELNPENEKYYSIRAHIHYNLGNYLNSIRDYTRAINILYENIENSDSDQVVQTISEEIRGLYLIRGSAFIQLNRTGEACDDFQRSRDLGERKAFNYIRRYCNY